MLFMGSLGAHAQTTNADDVKSLPTVTIIEKAGELQGKGKQELRDIPQSITVVTDKLIDDRIELLPCVSATEIPSRPQP